MFSGCTECPVTLCLNYWIRFLASCRLKNVTSIWVPFAAVANLWDYEIWNLCLLVIFSRLHGESIRLTRDIYSNVLEIKLPAFLENIPLYRHDIRGTTNLLGQPEISVGALKRARLRIQNPESGHFNTCYKHTGTPSEAHTTTSSTTYVCFRVHSHFKVLYISNGCESGPFGMTFLSR